MLKGDGGSLENNNKILSIVAMTCDFQQCGILTSVDSDEPVQPLLSFEILNDVQSVANTHRIFK